MSEIRIGCSGWNYPHWRERVYPKGLPTRRWLEHYATLFDAVEVNSTFYRLPRVEAVRGWVEQTPPGFLFAVKMSRYITHIRRLGGLETGIPLFYERIAPLAASPKLGPVLWQLPPTFKRNDERLAAALAALPAARHAFEFRHPTWYSAEVYELLRGRGAALVIPDSPKYPFRELELTADWTFVRFHHGPPGAERQLFGERDCRVGRADRRLAPRRNRRLRLLQQRLGGLRREERATAAGAAQRLGCLSKCSRRRSRSPKRSERSTTPS